MLSATRNKILLHAGFWTIFIAYEMSVARRFGSRAPAFDFACFYALNISFVYFHAHVAAPYSESWNHQIAAYICISALELLVYDFLSIGMDIFVSSIQKGQLTVEIYTLDFVRSLWRGVLFLGFGTTYYFGLRTIKVLKLILASERREAALENAHLRAQINPHLLFNVINFIYNLVEEVSPEAAKSTLLLANSMRYAMMPPQDDGLVELSKEVEQIERLVQINLLLLGDKISIVEDIDPVCYTPGIRIPPLLLVTLVENVFKHGNLIDAPAVISIKATGKELHFHTENLQANRRHVNSDKVGIRNAIARLEKQYGHNFIFDRRRDGSTFIVDLKLAL